MPDAEATVRAVLEKLGPLPEPVSRIGHGPAINFTSVQPALQRKPHGSILCYAEDDVLAERERAVRETMAALSAKQAEPVAWEVTQNGRTSLLSAAEFATKSFDYGGFRALVYATPPAPVSAPAAPQVVDALRMALRDMEAIDCRVKDSASLVGYFVNRLNALSAEAQPARVAVGLTDDEVRILNKAKSEALWRARRLDLCKCDHVEYCRHCYPPEFREGGEWHGA